MRIDRARATLWVIYALDEVSASLPCMQDVEGMQPPQPRPRIAYLRAEGDSPKPIPRLVKSCAIDSVTPRPRPRDVRLQAEKSLSPLSILDGEVTQISYKDDVDQPQENAQAPRVTQLQIHDKL
jgi:hypothetical protein